MRELLFNKKTSASESGSKGSSLENARLGMGYSNQNLLTIVEKVVK